MLAVANGQLSRKGAVAGVDEFEEEKGLVKLEPCPEELEELEPPPEEPPLHPSSESQAHVPVAEATHARTGHPRPPSVLLDNHDAVMATSKQCHGHGVVVEQALQHQLDPPEQSRREDVAASSASGEVVAGASSSVDEASCIPMAAKELITSARAARKAVRAIEEATAAVAGSRRKRSKPKATERPSTQSHREGPVAAFSVIDRSFCAPSSSNIAVPLSLKAYPPQSSRRIERRYRSPVDDTVSSAAAFGAAGTSSDGAVVIAVREDGCTAASDAGKPIVTQSPEIPFTMAVSKKLKHLKSKVSSPKRLEATQSSQHAEGSLPRLQSLKKDVAAFSDAAFGASSSVNAPGTPAAAQDVVITVREEGCTAAIAAGGPIVSGDAARKVRLAFEAELAAYRSVLSTAKASATSIEAPMPLSSPMAREQSESSGRSTRAQEPSHREQVEASSQSQGQRAIASARAQEPSHREHVEASSHAVAGAACSSSSFSFDAPPGRNSRNSAIAIPLSLAVSSGAAKGGNKHLKAARHAGTSRS